MVAWSPLAKNSLLKIFLVINICVFIYAVSRLRHVNKAADASSDRKIINDRTSPQERRLTSLESITPCDCQQNQRTISNLQTHVAALDSKLNDVRMQQLTAKKEDRAASKLQSLPEPHGHMLTKVGDDYNQSKTFQVPNIVHYIWYNEEPRPLEFHHMLSILSADKFIKPDVIYFHTHLQTLCIIITTHFL